MIMFTETQLRPQGCGDVAVMLRRLGAGFLPRIFRGAATGHMKRHEEPYRPNPEGHTAAEQECAERGDRRNADPRCEKLTFHSGACSW
eukprot:933854-Rhodomonas_salina.2